MTTLASGVIILPMEYDPTAFDPPASAVAALGSAEAEFDAAPGSSEIHLHQAAAMTAAGTQRIGLLQARPAPGHSGQFAWVA